MLTNPVAAASALVELSPGITTRRPSWQIPAVTMCGRHGGGKRHIWFGFVEPSGLDDRAPDPVAIGRPGHRLDDETDKSEAMVRVFEAGIGVNDRRRRQISTKLRFVEERAGVAPLATVGPIADDTGAVRQQLRERRLGDRRVEAVDVLPGAVVEGELTLFAQL